MQGLTPEVLGALGTQVVLHASVLTVAGWGLALVRRRSAAHVRGAWHVTIATILATPLLVPVLAPRLPALPFSPASLPHDLADPVLRVGAVAVSPATGVGLVWLLGALWMLARLARDHTAAWRTVRRATVLVDEPRVTRLLALAVARAGGGRRGIAGLQVVVSSASASPAIWGWRRPVLLMPVGFARWSDDELLGAFSHELAHVRQADWLWQLLGRVAVALTWPNPLVALAARRAALSRELAADDAALRGGADPRAYASHMIALARAGRPPVPDAAVALVPRSPLELRTRALFDGDRDRQPSCLRSHLQPTLLAATLVALLAAMPAWRCVEAPAGSAPAPADCP